MMGCSFSFLYIIMYARAYPDRESNAELSLRRTLLYPFNYQGACFSACKGTRFLPIGQEFVTISFICVANLHFHKAKKH